MSFLGLTALFLTAALLAVPLSKRLGLGSVLGYLAAGLVIGPWGLGFVEHVDDLLHFSELGIVLLLFLIGLELQPTRLWTMRRTVFGIGGAQVFVSTALIGTIAVALGLSWQAGLVVGAALCLSSTALALQLMAEKGHLRLKYGRTAFSILLSQDLAAIPIIALVPFLGPSMMGTDNSDGGGWQSAAMAVGAVVGLIVVGRYGLRHVLRLVAKTDIRELFTACALLTVIGSALLMQAAGLSMALGAFLAGVLLADSEFRPALETDIDPFKGLLLGLFFMAVGMSVNLGLFISDTGTVLSIAAGLIAVKAFVLYGLGVIEKLDRPGRRNLAISLSQGGEFAFVIFGIAAGASVIETGLQDLLNLSVTVSMALTPLLFLFSEMAESGSKPDDAPPEMEAMEDEHPVIIAGFGRFGQITGRILRAKKIGFTALERNAKQVDFVTGFGAKVYYGDASRIDLLHKAGTSKAKIFVIAVNDPDQSVQIAATVRQSFPRLKIIARARDRDHALRLMSFGVTTVIREMFYSSLEVSRNVLEGLGMAPHQANYVVETFRDHDERRLIDQRKLRGDQEATRVEAKKWADELEALFEADVAAEQAANEAQKT